MKIILITLLIAAGIAAFSAYRMRKIKNKPLPPVGPAYPPRSTLGDEPPNDESA